MTMPTLHLLLLPKTQNRQEIPNAENPTKLHSLIQRKNTKPEINNQKKMDSFCPRKSQSHSGNVFASLPLPLLIFKSCALLVRSFVSLFFQGHPCFYNLGFLFSSLLFPSMLRVVSVCGFCPDHNCVRSRSMHMGSHASSGSGCSRPELWSRVLCVDFL